MVAVASISASAITFVTAISVVVPRLAIPIEVAASTIVPSIVVALTTSIPSVVSWTVVAPRFAIPIEVSAAAATIVLITVIAPRSAIAIKVAAAAVIAVGTLLESPRAVLGRSLVALHIESPRLGSIISSAIMISVERSVAIRIRTPLRSFAPLTAPAIILVKLVVPELGIAKLDRHRDIGVAQINRCFPHHIHAILVGIGEQLFGRHGHRFEEELFEFASKVDELFGLHARNRDFGGEHPVGDTGSIDSAFLPRKRLFDEFRKLLEPLCALFFTDRSRFKDKVAAKLVEFRRRIGWRAHGGLAIMMVCPYKLGTSASLANLKPGLCFFA